MKCYAFSAKVQMHFYLCIDDGSKLTIKIDQFQHLRRDFVKAAEEYEKDSNALGNTSDKRERLIMLARIGGNRDVMDKNLKQMMNMNMKMHQKLKKSKDPKTRQPLETELQYKNLTVFQLQNTYFKLVKKQSKQVSKHKNGSYPQELTLQQLKQRKPLNRGFSTQSDHQSEQYIKQQQLLQAIKYIDDKIQQKMDYILDGLRMLNYNALTISQAIGVVHHKILINVENLDQNMGKLEENQKLLEEAAPLVSKPNCIMNVIIVVLLGVLGYFIVRKVMG